MVATSRFNRRDFLKLVGVNTAAALFPVGWFDKLGEGSTRSGDWPRLALEDIPGRVVAILEKTPSTFIGPDGYLGWTEPNKRYRSHVSVARTRWNIERSDRSNLLKRDKPWGIVLHWYGDKENFDKTIKGYLRGFDSLRGEDGNRTRTSAHFLVGDADLSESSDQAISILQTQIPDKEGTPYVASHLKPLDYLSHKNKKQYFVRALYQLSYSGYGTHTMLQEFFDGPFVDPNMYTFAIEATGYNYDHPDWAPNDQKIANVLSVVWAIMQRYGVLAVNIMGHQEIQLGKADPGKKFLALIRYLIGLNALLEDDDQVKLLVFGPFLTNSGSLQQAVEKYFSFIRDYLVLVGNQRSVYEWEGDSRYWFVRDGIAGVNTKLKVANQFLWPLSETFSPKGYYFLNPDSHEGLDLYTERAKSRMNKPQERSVHLVANGQCVFVGETCGHCQGKTVMFRHRQWDGAEIITVYSHLAEIGDLQVGKRYPLQFRVGGIRGERVYLDPYLHLAIAYGATWDTNLSLNPDQPLNAGSTWIKERFIDPIQYLRVSERPVNLRNDALSMM